VASPDSLFFVQASGDATPSGSARHEVVLIFFIPRGISSREVGRSFHEPPNSLEKSDGSGRESSDSLSELVDSLGELTNLREESPESPQELGDFFRKTITMGRSQS